MAGYTNNRQSVFGGRHWVARRRENLWSDGPARYGERLGRGLYDPKVENERARLETTRP